MTDMYTDIFRDDQDVYEVVQYALDGVLDNLDEELRSNFLASLQKPFTSKLVMEKMNKMVALATLVPDGTFTPGSEELEVFIPDGEPAPSSIDTWARGAVTTKKVAVSDNNFRRAMPGVSSTPSIASSHQSKRSKGTSAGTRSRIGSRAGTAYTDPLDLTGKIIELDDEFGDFAHLNSTGHMFDMLQKMKRNKAQGYVSKETSEKGEFEVIQEQLDKAEKEMKGKKFVLDRYGKPVSLGRVNVETLPSMSDSPMLTVKDKQVNERPSYGNGDNGHGHVTTSTDDMALQGGEKKKKLRVAGHRSIEEGTFMPAITLASSLAGIDSIPKLSNGVSVKSVSGTRSGQEIPENPQRLSKKTYMKSQSSLYSSSDSNGGESTVSFSRSLGAAGDKRQAKLGGNASMASDGLNTNSLISAKSIDFLEDLDPYEGGKQVNFAPPTPRDMTDEELGLGVITKPSPMGKVIGKVPDRRSDLQKALLLKELTDSPNNGKPRDRVLPKNMTPTSQRLHLPAPPLGEITGHGMSYEKFQDSMSKDIFAPGDDEWTSDWR